MSKNIISFVSTRGRDLNSDLQIVKDDLMTALPDMEFQYYLNKTATKIPLINTKMEDARRTFCSEAQNIICMDPSIPIKIPSASENETRLLLASPFDYQFNIFMKYLENPKQKKKQTLQKEKLQSSIMRMIRMFINCIHKHRKNSMKTMQKLHRVNHGRFRKERKHSLFAFTCTEEQTMTQQQTML